ncbi:hypothetical protein [Sulfitobacter donghicola]|uniref:Uncharacterized protein n=1 Tax=Sulfitobacter donghicola DSW-25 = KCTC 12864 = JCM 14565 TaxID=1300350 RepID=A0A073IF56_9RHOB|nr:hypothetical protein [Sulfitobacter donghicola]KEJ88111.1 hypothetical protein DSW25_17425 [Sulfitobacter donghicola DSW-25 = KCTC 12864 = JCM 14565]
MTFADTYREERLINRRSRARKARIMGRVIGFGLTACLVFVLRTEPQMQDLMEDLVISLIGGGSASEQSIEGARADAINSLGYEQGSQEAQRLEQLGLSEEGESTSPTVSQLPQSRVKINRPTSG